MPSWNFPRQDVVDELKEKHWLKPKSKVRIERGFLKDYSVRLGENFIVRHYWNLFCSLVIIYNVATPILRHYKIISQGNPYPAIIYSLLMCLLLINSFLNIKRTVKSLGYIEMSDIFIEFLDKFGRGRELALAEMPAKILFSLVNCFKKVNFDRKWWIEYDILVMAYGWCKKDPQAFQKETQKARNKKELRLVLGIS